MRFVSTSYEFHCEIINISTMTHLREESIAETADVPTLQYSVNLVFIYIFNISNILERFNLLTGETRIVC